MRPCCLPPYALFRLVVVLVFCSSDANTDQTEHVGTSLQTVLEDQSTVTDFATRPLGPDLLGILIEEIAALRDSIQTPQSHLHAANHIHNNELIFTSGYSQGVIEFFCEVR